MKFKVSLCAFLLSVAIASMAADKKMGASGMPTPNKKADSGQVYKGRILSVLPEGAIVQCVGTNSPVKGSILLEHLPSDFKPHNGTLYFKASKSGSATIVSGARTNTFERWTCSEIVPAPSAKPKVIRTN